MNKPTFTAKITIMGSLLLAVAFSGCVTQQQPGGERVYPYSFDSANIEYKLDGNIQGTTTVMIKGDKAVHETQATTTENGEEQTAHTKIIDLGETMYQIDLNTNAGQSSENPIYMQLRETNPDDRMDFLTRLALGLPENTSPEDMPEPKAQREIAGETCDLYDVQTIGEICLWNGIPLYSSMEIPEVGINSSSTATSIQLNVDIPESAFDVPEEADITEIQPG